MLLLSSQLLLQIHGHGERAYPEEGAGFLIGSDGTDRTIHLIHPLTNCRETAARHDRYLITPADYRAVESEADRLGLILLGVFRSHPDHHELPSEFDREWAQPFFSYVITSVRARKAIESRSWRLQDDRSKFLEEPIQYT